MIKKGLAWILMGIILAVSAVAGAEYKQYRLTEGDAGGSAGIVPLDARNAVVIARPAGKNPWHVTWYRDGEKYLDLSGPASDPAAPGMEIPYPAVWDGGQLTMLCHEWTGGTNHAGAYQAYLARWTESGLERTGDLPEGWYGSFRCGESILFRRENQWRIRYNGKETILPEDVRIRPDAAVTDCIPLKEGAFLLTVSDLYDTDRHLTGVDQEKERYRISLPVNAYLQTRDGQGGFFSTEDWPSGDYSPLTLAHYDADGQKDRTLELGGSNVAVQFFGSAADPDTGLCTLYGTAVAHSRKVYTVFAMALDAGLNVRSLDVRKIDPAYGDYNPSVYFAKDGTAWVYFCDMKGKGKRPVLIPFALLEQSKEDHGLTLR